MKIFTSGKMTGLSYEETTGWRKRFKEAIDKAIGDEVSVIDPTVFFDVVDGCGIAMKWEINQIISSDIVVVNLNQISSSIGTLMELGIVEGYNKCNGRKIWVLGIGDSDTKHPWIESVLDMRFDSIDGAVMFIRDFLMV